MTAAFLVDERLDKDSVHLFDGKLSQFRLMDEKRFPWLILVPRVDHAVELIDLTTAQQQQLLLEINIASHVLRKQFACHKLNIGALGNIVNQLHVHVIARTHEDAAWPNPVWGHGIRQPYAESELATLRSSLTESLRFAS
jgi:diadenosine tetraphosphate (Ap4A) HIT family hydrolase